MQFASEHLLALFILIKHVNWTLYFPAKWNYVSYLWLWSDWANISLSNFHILLFLWVIRFMNIDQLRWKWGGINKVSAFCQYVIAHMHWYAVRSVNVKQVTRSAQQFTTFNYVLCEFCWINLISAKLS